MKRFEKVLKVAPPTYILHVYTCITDLKGGRIVTLLPKTLAVCQFINIDNASRSSCIKNIIIVALNYIIHNSRY